MKANIVNTTILILLLSMMGINPASSMDNDMHNLNGNILSNTDPYSAYNYGRIKALDKNYKEAIKWLSIASDYGIPEAEYLLALFHDKGLGTKKIIKKHLICIKTLHQKVC